MRPHSLRRILALLTLVLLLPGCAVKFVYNQLDWLIPIYVQGYLPLEDTQDELLEQMLEQNLDWHRDTQLPQYAAFLKALEADMRDGLDRRELTHYNDQMEIFGDQLMAKLAPDIANLLLTSTDKQRQQLYEKFEKENGKFAKKYVNVEEEKLRDRREKEMRKYVERWIGDLTEDQEAALTRWRNNYIPIEQEVLEHREAWQAALKAILESEATEAEKQQEIIRLFTSSDPFIQGDYERKLNDNRALTETYLLQLSTELEPEQQQQASDKLLSIAEDFTELATDD